MSNRRRAYIGILCWVLVFLGLYIIGRHNFLLFHGLTEVFSVVVAFAIFMVAWHSRQHADSNYFLFIGIAYLFIAGIDLVHTLSYRGMGVFSGYDTNLPTQLWIAARYMESISLFLAPVFISRKMRMSIAIPGYAIAFSLILVSIFRWRIFPDCFVAGEGLTLFKIVSEYIISAIFLATIFVMWQKRRKFDASVLRTLIASFALSIGSELAFTLYANPYGPPNAIGHFLKVLSFVFMYKAIVVIGLETPYAILFRNLQQSEEKYRLLIEGTPDAVTSLDINGNFTSWNEGASEMFGFTARELLGKHVQRFVPAELIEEQKEMAQKAIETGRVKGYETVRVSKEGIHVPVEMTLNRREDAQGNTIGISAFIRDITERKQAEGALRDERQRLAGILEATHVGTWEWNIQSGEIVLNELWANTIGYTLAELSPISVETWKKFRHPDDLEASDRLLERHLSGELGYYECEARMHHRNGDWVWVLDRGRVVTWTDDGQPLMMMGTQQNITERKQGEAERESMIQMLEILNARTGLRELMKSLLRFMRELSGCEAVGIRLRDGNDFPYYETSGFSDEFLDAETYLCVEDVDGQLARDEVGNPILECMCGNILCGRFDPARPFFTDAGSFVSNNTSKLLADTTEEDRQARTRNRCNAEGYESVLLVPLRAGGETFGLLQFNDPREGRLSPRFIDQVERMARDVAIALAQRQAQEALYESEQLAEEYINSLPGLFYVFDEERFIRWNKQWEAATGYSTEELATKYGTDFFEGRDKAHIEECMQKVFREGAAVAEVDLVTKDGQRIPYYFTGVRKRLRGKDYLVGLGIDITKRKQVEKALQESEANLSRAQGIARLGSWTREIATGEMRWSDEMYRIYGLPLETPLSIECVQALVHPKDRSLFEQVIAGPSHGDAPESLDHRIVKHTGETRFVVSRREVIFDQSGNPLQIVGTVQDITEQRQAEEERTQLEEQYRQSQKVEAIGRLAGGVAHDLNNMLTPILGYAEILLGEFGPNDARRNSIDAIIQAGFRARDLIRQLLAFSRKQTLEYRPVNMNEVVVGFETLLRRTIREDIELEYILTPEIPTIMADIGQLEQVLMNLAVNAQDAMPAGGRLTIETALTELDEDYAAKHQGVRPGTYIILSVSDTGIGIDDEVREHLFEPFYSTKGEQGTGLGLATVYGIIKQHGGNIWAYSEKGEGTTFRAYLPVTMKTEVIEDVAKESPQLLEGSGTILLVEDNEHVRDLTCAILEQQGYSVLVAGSGPEALKVLEVHDEPVHLLLTDVVMPGMSGKELTVQVAQLYPDLKVLYMSGYTHDVIAHHGVLDEGIAFVQKPFTMLGLTTKIREVLEQD